MGVIVPNFASSTEDRASGAQVIDGSLKFDSNKSTNLSKTLSSSGNRKTWTWSGWLKPSDFNDDDPQIFTSYTDANNRSGIFLDSSEGYKLSYYSRVSGTSQADIETNAVIRDFSSFYHFVISVDTTQSTSSDRIKIYINGNLQTLNVATYPSQNYDTYTNIGSVAHYIGKYAGSPNYYGDGLMSQVYFIDGQALGPEEFGFTDPLTNTWRPKKFIATGPNNGSTWSNNWSASGNGFASGAGPAQVFDGSSENYLNNAAGGQIVTWDTSSYTLGGNLKILCSSSSGLYDIYVNGTKAADTTNSISLIDCGTVSDINEIQFAGTTYGTSDDLGSAGIYLYEILIDGVPLLDGDTLNVGVNGFYLPMDGNSPIGQDKSGQGNDWTKNNFSGTFNDPDVLKDSPSGAAFGGPPTSGITTTSSAPSNYATLNPLDPRGLGNSPTFSEGNLRINDSSSYDITSTIGADSGKWYWEVEMIDVGTTICGIIDIHNNRSSQFSMSSPTVYYATTRNNGTREGNQSGGTNFTYTDGDTVAWALDVDNLKLYGYKNGSLQSTATITQTDITWSPYVYGEATTDHRFNFGQKPFKFPPPEGFQPLNAANVRPETVIARPDQYVGISTWSGDGNTRDISVGLKPDLVWIKNISSSSYWHQLQDSVRGPAKSLFSNEQNAEDANSGSGYLSSFNYSGFTVTAGSVDINNVNGSSNNYVAWAWKAGGNKNTFNVDDVGYASASDVNMNVGGLNISFYNQNQTWSNDLVSDTGTYFGTHTPDKAFDGDPTTKCTSSTGTGGTLTLDLSNNNLTGTLEVVTNTGMRVAVTHSGGTTTISAATSPDQEETINFGYLTSISEIVVTGVTAPSNAMLYRIKLNGAELIDSGVSVTNVPSIANTGCSVGTKQGFSIIGYTGTDNASDTISHGLSQKPDFAIFKNRTDGTDDWIVYHSSQGATKRGKLNLANAFDSQTSQFNDTEPTSSLFTIGTYDNINKLSKNYISYIWHNVPGLQKFGQFTGNSDADGAYVELGFKPAILLIKNDNSTGDWIIWDNERNPYNPVNRQVWPYTNSGTYGAYDQVGSNYPLDFLSNGFKMRTTDADMNDSGRTYIYAAWAEAPTVNLYGGGANAR